MVGRGFKLGRLFGITIQVDWSWLVILALIVWNLFGIFGRVNSSWSVNMRWGLSILAALLFFASVLVHELAHALVAQSQGLPVSNITLFLLGGAAHIQREPSSPRNEFFMAAAGPAASLLIGILLIGIALVSLFVDQIEPGFQALLNHLTPARTVLTWLGSMNIMLAIFNMIPGFPLDGGRVLRSILWALTKNIRTATRWAAASGQFVGLLMMFAGGAMIFGFRLPMLGTGLASGAWLIFIGWFLKNASVQSYQQVAIQEVLEGVTVSRLMHANPTTIEPDCTVTDLVGMQGLDSENEAFPVLDEENLVGLVTMEDAQRIPRSEWDSHLIREIMTPETRLVTTSPTEAATDALEKLLEGNVHQLPVVNRGPGMNGIKLLGVLRRADILRWLQLQLDHGRRTV
jgi:Zn-dependent protease